MIIDAITSTTSFEHLHWFKEIVRFIQQSDIANLPAGRYDVIGDHLFVIIADDVARNAHPPLEAHRTYIDLQLTLSGSFDVLWRPLSSCTQELRPYSEEDDVLLMSDEAQTRLHLPEGVAAVFFPEDAHAPQPPLDAVRKAVFKIKCDLRS